MQKAGATGAPGAGLKISHWGRTLMVEENGEDLSRLKDVHGPLETGKPKMYLGYREK